VDFGGAGWRGAGMTAETIARGLDLRRVGHTWRGACPVHGGSSFTLSEKAGKPVFYCWSGCDRAAILAELKARGLWPESSLTPEQKRDWATERRRNEADMLAAGLFGVIAASMADQVLEELPAADLQRAIYTGLLAAVRTEAGLLAEYREWKKRDPKLTRALVSAGAGHQQRVSSLIQFHTLGAGGQPCRLM
jgi:hypothetical protein